MVATKAHHIKDIIESARKTYLASIINSVRLIHIVCKVVASRARNAAVVESAVVWDFRLYGWRQPWHIAVAKTVFIASKSQESA